MAVTNTEGRFNVGRDVTIVLITSFGRIDIPNVTGFSCKQETQPVKSDRLDGVMLNAALPKGWSGTFECDRGSRALDDLTANIEQTWFNGGGYQVATLYQYISEPDGSQSVWAFDNVALTLEDAGDWRPDQIVKQRLSFVANRRRAV